MGRQDRDVRISLQTLRVLEAFLENPTDPWRSFRIPRPLRDPESPRVRPVRREPHPDQ